ncbi:MAG: hypothetical protein RL722_1769 [Pseudomonadota bacterium]|jgi:2-aminoadipate transaminase
MSPSLPPAPSLWTPSRRSLRTQSSAIRELLKLCERPGMLSMAGGLPAAESFPAEALRAVADRVLRDQPAAALQYGPSEGLAGLRAWVADHLRGLGMTVDPAQVLITSGSQQGLDLLGKVLAEEGAPLAVESPTYLGALQAFAPYGPRFVALEGDAEGPDPEALARLAHHSPGCRFAYLLPNFQNPTGRMMSAARRTQIVGVARRIGLPLVEDNPYGELWCEAPPPAPLASLWPEGTVYLGSFSKVLAPGLRLGYMVAPAELHARLVHAKQAADLHTSSLAQHLVLALLRGQDTTGADFLATQMPALRERYRRHRDAMQAALQQELPAGCQWQLPGGGMFFWLQLPEGLDAQALLPLALEAGIAYVPGIEFHPPGGSDAAAVGRLRRSLRLSFVTLSPAQIAEAVARLGRVVKAAQAGQGPLPLRAAA